VSTFDRLINEVSNRLRSGAVHLEGEFDQLKERLGALGRAHDAPAHIRPYRGFGNSKEFHLQGRLLRGDPERLSEEKHQPLENLLAAFRRFESDEMPGVEVQVSFGGVSRRLETDEEGYYGATLPIDGVSDDGATAWHDVEIRADVRGPDSSTAALHLEATCPVLVPSRDARVGIISDLDDTVLVTGATRVVSMVRRSLFENAWQRVPFGGVGALFRGLESGGGSGPDNPFFYVSSSPHNLYVPLVQFLEIRQLPRGPVLLRDVGLTRDRWLKDAHDEHKAEKIDRILGTYPDLPFVLIGDSGQHDAKIYLDASLRHPGRVLAIYIRDEIGDGRLTGLVTEAERHGTPMVLARDSEAIAHHAAGLGIVAPDIPDRVREAIARERAND